MKELQILPILISLVIGALSTHVYYKTTRKDEKSSQAMVTPIEQKVNKDKSKGQEQIKNGQVFCDQKIVEVEKKLNSEISLCQTTIQDLTVKSAELNAIVKGMIANQEERTKNWLNIKDAKVKILAEEKKEAASVEQRLAKLTENYENRIDQMIKGYLKKCPCSGD